MAIVYEETQPELSAIDSKLSAGRVAWARGATPSPGTGFLQEPLGARNQSLPDWKPFCLAAVWAWRARARSMSRVSSSA